jgi:hypothetical protein
MGATCGAGTKCLLWPYFNVFLEDHIRQVWLYEEFEDTKGVIRIRKSKMNRQHNAQKKIGQKDKQRSTKHYT